MKIAVRVTNWIGDVVMNLPGLEILRENFPEAEISAIARPWVRGILSFRSDLVDRVIPFDDHGSDQGVRAFWRFCRNLRRERFDLGLAFTAHIKGALMLRLAGIPVRAGFATPETTLFLNRRLDRKTLPVGTRHQSENYLDLMRTAGLAVPRRPIPRLQPDPVLAAEVGQSFLQAHSGPLLVVHAGAAYVRQNAGSPTATPRSAGGSFAIEAAGLSCWASTPNRRSIRPLPLRSMTLR